MKAYTLSLIALALTSSLAQAATADLVLDKVVTLNRHGIRPQMDTAKIQAMSPETFPHFQGKDGEADHARLRCRHTHGRLFAGLPAATPVP